MSEERELIWVSKSQAEFFKALEDDTKRGDFVLSLIEKTKKQMINDVENLDDDLLQYKSFVLRYSREFKKAYDEQSINIEKLWEDCTKPADEVRSKANKIKDEIKGIQKLVDETKEQIKSIDFYGIERVIALIDRFNSMTERDKEIMTRILNNKEV